MFACDKSIEDLGSEVTADEKEAVEKAFTSDAADRTYLKGCMSRKKQVVPQLTDALK